MYEGSQGRGKGAVSYLTITPQRLIIIRGLTLFSLTFSLLSIPWIDITGYSFIPRPKKKSFLEKFLLDVKFSKIKIFHRHGDKILHTIFWASNGVGGRYMSPREKVTKEIREMIEKFLV